MKGPSCKVAAVQENDDKIIYRIENKHMFTGLKTFQKALASQMVFELLKPLY